jgi:hypothetical protein
MFLHMHNTFKILIPKMYPDSVLANAQYSAKSAFSVTKF